MKKNRNTAVKTAIFELIKKLEVALSHAEIQKISKELCDRVTIYRVLDCLVSEDVIHKIATPDGTLKYAACNHDHNKQKHLDNHILFSCEKCLLVTCLDNVEPTFKIPKNYSINKVNFSLSGICLKCNETS